MSRTFTNRPAMSRNQRESGADEHGDYLKGTTDRTQRWCTTWFEFIV